MSRISNNSFKVNSALEQIVQVSGGTITPSGTQNVDVVGNTIGLATESTLSNVSSELANQTTDLNNIASSTSQTSSSCQNIDSNTSNISSDTATIASNTTTIEGKITQGYDATVTSGGNGLQQVVIYGRDSGGNLDACTINGSGELVVTTSGGGSATHNGSQANLMNAVSASSGTISNVITTTTSNNVNIFGNTTGTGGITVQQSVDNTNFYDVGYSAFPNTSGDFAVSFAGHPANYWRIKATETSTITATLVHS